MTLKNIYSIRIFLRIARLVLAFFAFVDGASAIDRLFYRDISRGLLVNVTFFAFYVLLIILSGEGIRIVSEKIAPYESQK